MLFWKFNNVFIFLNYFTRETSSIIKHTKKPLIDVSLIQKRPIKQSKKTSIVDVSSNKTAPKTMTKTKDNNNNSKKKNVVELHNENEENLVENKKVCFNFWF